MSDSTRKPLQLDWRIRRARPTEGNIIFELHKRLNRPSRSDSKAQEYFVAIGDGEQVVGCAAVRKRKNVGYLYGLAVDRTWRRRGIGHALTERRLEWLHSQNAAQAFVLSMFWNIKFFKKHGFSVVSKRQAEKLSALHSDFVDLWSSRSALLSVSLKSQLIRDRGLFK